MVDVVEAFGIGCVVIGIGNDVAKASDVDVVGRQAIADAHLVQVRVAGERKQRSVLVLPSKATHGERATGFQYGNAHGFPTDEAAGP